MAITVQLCLYVIRPRGRCNAYILRASLVSGLVEPVITISTLAVGTEKNARRLTFHPFPPRCTSTSLGWNFISAIMSQTKRP